MPANRSKSEKHDAAAKPVRRDPYEVLGVSKNSADQEIKSAYRRMALKYASISVFSTLFLAHEALFLSLCLCLCVFFFEFDISSCVISLKF